MSAKVIVTCGPAYEPVDDVRRITNVSTGELGTRLAERLQAAGMEVICLRGVGATHRLPGNGITLRPFTTNSDLAGQLEVLGAESSIDAVFHAAALCDFRVKTVHDSSGAARNEAKLASRGGNLFLELEPAEKVIPKLRTWFPSALIVGWKYELDGTREDALAKGRRQISENSTDACVVNGSAYGEGLGLMHRDVVIHFPNKDSLCVALVEFVRSKRGGQQIQPSLR